MFEQESNGHMVRFPWLLMAFYLYKKQIEYGEDERDKYHSSFKESNVNANLQIYRLASD